MKRPRPTIAQRKAAYRFAAGIVAVDRHISPTEAATLTEAVRKATVQLQRPNASERRRESAAATLQRVAVRLAAQFDFDTLTYSWPARKVQPLEAPCYEA
jgi:hypothetical protein